MANVRAPERIDFTTALSEQTKRRILIGVLLGVLLMSLDQTILAAALPRILTDLRGVGLLAWLSTAYLLASTTTVPIYGKLSDLYGRKPLLLIGLTIFLSGSILCGLAPTIEVLAACRAIQGLGGGALTALAFTIPADLYVPAERGRLQGVFTAVFALGSMLGPFLGGVLTDLVGWRWIFYINLPVGIAAMVCIAIFMPRLQSGLRAPIDFAGAVLLVSTLVPLLTALTLDKQVTPWNSAVVLILLGVAALALVLFLLVESRAESPILSLQLFKVPTYALIVAISVLVGAAFLAIVLFVTLFLVNVAGTTATGAGTALLPLIFCLMVSGIASGAFVQRTGRYKLVALVGLSFICTGFGLFSTLTVNSTATDVRIWLGVLGFGFGATFPQLNLALQNAVTYAVVGTATASRQFFQQLGQMIGAAVYGALIASMLTTTIADHLAPIKASLAPETAAMLDPEKLRNGREEAITELAAATAHLPPAQRRALTRAVDLALKQSFAESIGKVYGFALPMSLVALLLAFAIPNLPLRRTNRIEPESSGSDVA